MQTAWYDPVQIRSLLRMAGRSQKDLAAALGVAPSAVSRMLSGTRALKAAEIAILEEFFQSSGATQTPVVRGERFHDGAWRPVQLGIAARLQAALAIAEVAEDALASEIHISRERLGAMLAGKGDFPDLSLWDRIANKLGIPRGWLLYGGIGVMRPTEVNRRDSECVLPKWSGDGAPELSDEAIAHHTAINGRIPIYERFAWSHSAKKTLAWRLAEYRLPPSALMGVHQGYGLFIGDNALAPRFRYGEVVFVHPWRPPGVGDIACITIKEHRYELVIGYLKSRMHDHLEIAVTSERHGDSLSIPFIDIDQLGSVVGMAVE
ncbi:helix-turn-helix transcriptional regulator [Pelagibacterium sp.]|uniref:helix-turn-helix transcriptional regulator n=1 Tax=Pelagibacterium sp. TaxID=1967288 RepID=UPI003A929AEA